LTSISGAGVRAYAFAGMNFFEVHPAEAESVAKHEARMERTLWTFHW
jgi:hypothetical protein